MSFLNKPMEFYTKRAEQVKQKQERWNVERTSLEAENKINQEYKQLKKSSRKIKMPSTSKLMLGFLFINCTAIELFTGWVTYESILIGQPDYSPLITLIGAVVGEVIGLGTYYVKACKENTEGGVTYLNAQYKLKHPNEEEEGVG